MWGFLLALAVVGGLVRAAATRPERLASGESTRLDRLRRAMKLGKLSLDLAEDGAVLARRAGRADLEQQFRSEAARLRRKRSTR